MTTRLSDLIVPAIFAPYKQQITEQKSRIIQSGAVVRSQMLDNFLAGAGLTVAAPSFRDLVQDEENVSTDDPAQLSAPKKIQTGQEIAVRLSRNQSWSSMDLAGDLIGVDPLNAIANRVGYYWTLRAQAAFIAAMRGIFADNDAAPTATEHSTGDLTIDIKGASYAAGVTDFSAGAFIDAVTTAGDSKEGLGMVMVHSIVHARMQKNNLIEFIPDSRGEIMIPTFLGREVIVDDAMPFAGGIAESWIFGRGAVQLGLGSPKVPTEVDRVPSAGNGSGQEILHDRVEWAFHPEGHAYVGTSPAGGPSNAATTNNLANAASWKRVFTERKQIKIARLVTREM